MDITLRKLGYAPSHSYVRAAVVTLLQRAGNTKPLEIHWIEGKKKNISYTAKLEGEWKPHDSMASLPRSSTGISEFGRTIVGSSQSSPITSIRAALWLASVYDFLGLLTKYSANR